MPSISESRRQVEERLQSERNSVDHDAVLAGLQDEIDRHNAVKEDVKRSMRRDKQARSERSGQRSPPPTKFRFKEGTEEPKHRRKHRSRRRGESEHDQRKRRKRAPSATLEDVEAAHPFPREPTDPTDPGHGTDDAAFRDSLFDALADDEGAAYWESVYSQPIHVYSRPTVQTEKGELEQMTDEEYTAYVKTKMWEKKHPEIVFERERSERRRREEEEEKMRQREEFIRRKEQDAWQKGGRRRDVVDSEDDSDLDENRGPGRKARYKYEFAGEKKWSASEGSGKRPPRKDYLDAWSQYLVAWDKLKHELLSERQNTAADFTAEKPKVSKRIPWPVLASKPLIKANIEDFMQHAPSEQEHTLVQILKAERVRWHPDKVQQRFGGSVDEETMKVVTGVFQVVDGLLEEERKMH